MAETKLGTTFLMTILHMRLSKAWTLATLTATGMGPHIPVGIQLRFLYSCGPHFWLIHFTCCGVITAMFRSAVWVSRCRYTGCNTHGLPYGSTCIWQHLFFHCLSLCAVLAYNAHPLVQQAAEFAY